MPVRIWIWGRDVLAARPFAPVVARHMRGSLLHSFAMYRHGAAEFRSRGGALIYAVPNPKWVGVLKRFPELQGGSFALWSQPLPLARRPSLPPGWRAAPLPAWDDRVDRLWAQWREFQSCTLVRDARVLRWKAGQGDYVVTLVERDDGEAAGLVACRHKGDRQWLVCDLLAADLGDSLRATLAAAGLSRASQGV